MKNVIKKICIQLFVCIIAIFMLQNYAKAVIIETNKSNNITTTIYSMDHENVVSYSELMDDEGTIEIIPGVKTEYQLLGTLSNFSKALWTRNINNLNNIEHYPNGKKKIIYAPTKKYIIFKVDADIELFEYKNTVAHSMAWPQVLNSLCYLTDNVKKSEEPRLDLSYMMPFYTETNGSMINNNVQKAIMKNDTDLYRANNAFITYKKSEGEDNLIIKKEKNVSVEVDDQNIAKIGSLSINKYKMFENEKIKNFSGKEVTKSKTYLGGIISGTIELEDKSGKSVKKEIGDSNSDVYIESDKKSNNLFPAPGESFYICVKNNDAKYKKIKNITFYYRKTTTKGWAATTTYYENMMGSEVNPVNTDYSKLIIPLYKDDEENKFYPSVIVTETPVSLDLNLDLIKANVSIKNYVSSVNGCNIDKVEWWSHDNSTGIGSRADWLQSDKGTKQAVALKDKEIQFTVEVTNNGKYETDVYLKYELLNSSNIIENVRYIKYNADGEIDTNNTTIPKFVTVAPGKTRKIIVKGIAKKSGNTKASIDDVKIDGKKVNNAGSPNADSDFFIIKDEKIADVSIKNYISSVKGCEAKDVYWWSSDSEGTGSRADWSLDDKAKQLAKVSVGDTVEFTVIITNNGEEKTKVKASYILDGCEYITGQNAMKVLYEDGVDINGKNSKTYKIDVKITKEKGHTDALIEGTYIDDKEVTNIGSPIKDSDYFSSTQPSKDDLKANVSINIFVSSVNNCNEKNVEYIDNSTTKEASRRNWSEDDKRDKKAKASNGNDIEFTIVISNNTQNKTSVNYIYYIVNCAYEKKDEQEIIVLERNEKKEIKIYAKVNSDDSGYATAMITGTYIDNIKVDNDGSPTESEDYFGNENSTIDPPSPNDGKSIKGEVYVKKVEHSNGTNPQVTFDGKAEEAYAEYGDKITFGVKVQGTYEVPENELNKTFYYYGESDKKDKAKITLSVQLPEEIYKNSEKYIVLIDGVAKKIDQQTFTYSYDADITTEEEKSDSYEDKTIYLNTYEYEYDDNGINTDINRNTSTQKITKRQANVKKITLSENESTISVINISGDTNHNPAIRVSLESIEYTHYFGKQYKEKKFKFLQPEYWKNVGDEKPSDYSDIDYLIYPNGNESYTYYKKVYDTKEYTIGYVEGDDVSGSCSYTESVDLGTASYKINDYSLSLNQYIDTYNAEMNNYNVNHGFEEGLLDSFSNVRKKYSESEPLELEKYETLTILTTTQNTANNNLEVESDSSRAGKYATRVRPEEIEITIGKGLKVTSTRINKGNTNITNSFNIDVSDDGVIRIKADGSNTTLLSPGEEMKYYVDVEVTASNMSLDNIKVSAEIINITNVNHRLSMDKNGAGQSFDVRSGDVPDRYVDNLSSKTKDSNYVKLKDLVIAGNVWFDKDDKGYMVVTDKDKQLTTNVNVILYSNKNSKDKFIEEERIQLKNTDSGFYTFGRMPKATEDRRYIQYYVEFEYDGVKYKPTEKYGYISNLNDGGNGKKWRQGFDTLPGEYKNGSTAYLTDSNAYEFDDDRISFNNKYQTIKYKSTNSGIPLEYTKNGHISELKDDITQDRIMKARSFILKDDSNTVINSLTNTNKLFLSYENDDDYETEYLKYINLGLIEREKVDLSLKADLYSVTNTINGEEMKYLYDENDFKGDYQYNKTGVYSQYIRCSDYNYRYDKYYSGIDTNLEDEVLQTYKKESSELNTEITYKIKITNEDKTNENIKAAVNELTIYYNKNFMQPGINVVKRMKTNNGMLEDESYKSVYEGDNDITNIMTKSNYNKETNRPTNYGVLYYDFGNDYLAKGESKTIYITFTVAKDEDRALKINNPFDITAEIGAYSTKYSENYTNVALRNKSAGLIDMDSQPDNVSDDGINVYYNYEDDTYQVDFEMKRTTTPPPEIDPNTNDCNNTIARKISGIVWKDENKNGKYDNTENKVAGVKVSLWEITQIIDEDTTQKKYIERQAKNGQGEKIEYITDSNGEYLLKGFIPGYYIVKFDYGYNENDENSLEYNGQDYKSTTYYNGDYYTEKNHWQTDDIASISNYDYFDIVKKELEKIDVSDALDDEIRRLNVNSYSEIMTSEKTKVFNNKQANKKTLTSYTSMFADSTIFYVKPEGVKSDQVSVDANFVKNWELKDFDFGLQYRPENSIVLDKEIDHINIKGSDNNDLVNLYFKTDDLGKRVINTEKSTGYNNAQFLPNDAKNQRGFLNLNMDTDILEGAVVTVEYSMKATNNSEEDKINKNLADIRTLLDAINKGYTSGGYVDSEYSANATAEKLLHSKYYATEYDDDEKEHYEYLSKIKKPYISGENSSIDGVDLLGSEYYGMYLGENYYKGVSGINDTEAILKVNNVLDYVDNDLAFRTSDNKSINNIWQAVTSKFLNENKLLDFETLKDNVVGEEDKYLVDKDKIRYDIDGKKSNLALSIDTSRNDISKFLSKNENGNIRLVASKVLSAQDLSEGRGLEYENISEIIKYTSLNGRITALPKDFGGGSAIGNADATNEFGYKEKKYEDDTDATEVIKITPPTGLTK